MFFCVHINKNTIELKHVQNSNICYEYPSNKHVVIQNKDLDPLWLVTLSSSTFVFLSLEIEGPRLFSIHDYL